MKATAGSPAKTWSSAQKRLGQVATEGDGGAFVLEAPGQQSLDHARRGRGAGEVRARAAEDPSGEERVDVDQACHDRPRTHVADLFGGLGVGSRLRGGADGLDAVAADGDEPVHRLIREASEHTAGEQHQRAL